MKRILVLGGHGFLGTNLQQLFDTDSQYQMFYISRRDGFDITVESDLYKLLHQINPDIIIHAAANVGSINYVSKYCSDVIHDNTLMYLTLYKCVSEFNKNILIINPISNCSYPGIIDIQHEEMWFDGPIHESVQSYGTPKKLAFVLSECYRKQHGIRTLNLILPNAYGPYDYVDEQKTHAMNGIIMRMIKSQNNGDTEFLIWGTGTPIREWIYMGDVARIIKMILDNEKYDIPNIINIGQEHGISIIESVNLIKSLLNYDVELVYDTSKQDGAPIKILGNRLFKEFFGDFKFTEVSVGINNTIQYYSNKLKP